MAFRVALTFDAEHPDRPCRPLNAERLLDGLDRLGAMATFFVQGRWAEAYPRTARRMAEAGHLLGNHSHFHARMPAFTKAGMRADVTSAETAIRDAAGVDPRPWFRCPFGDGTDDPRVSGVLATLGYAQPVGWHVDPHDWDTGSRRGLEDAVVSATIDRGDEAVILLHTWPDPTSAALDGVVTRLRDAGAELVRLDALEQVPTTIPDDHPMDAD